MNHFIYCWINLYKYDGRASRSEFGWFILFTIIFAIFLGLFEALIIKPLFGLNTTTEVIQQITTLDTNNVQHIETIKITKLEFLGVLSNIFIVLSILPTIALLSRRLHDLNKAAWYQIILWLAPFVMINLMAFIPSKITFGINTVIALYLLFSILTLFFQKSKQDNKYGKKLNS